MRPSIRARSSAVGRRPSRSNGSRMLPSASSVGTRLKAWNTKPTRRRRRMVSSRSESPVMSVSPIHARPEVGGIQPRHDVHQGGLARPGRPHDRGELAAADADADAVERADLARAGAVGLRELLHPGGEAQVGRCELHAPTLRTAARAGASAVRGIRVHRKDDLRTLSGGGDRESSTRPSTATPSTHGDAAEHDPTASARRRACASTRQRRRGARR